MSSRIVKNSFLSAVSGAATLLAGFVSTILVARVLGVQATGAVAYATWLSMIGCTLLDLGVQSTLSRYLPELSRDGAARAESMTLALFRPFVTISASAILVAGLGAMIFGLAPLSHAERIPGITSICALCALQTLANFALGELRGRQAFRTAAQVNSLSMTLQITCVVVGAFALGEIGVILGYCVGSAPLALRALRHFRSHAPTTFVLERGYVRFAMYSWAGGVASALVWSRSEVFFLQRSWGPEAVALLTAGLTFANLAVQGPLLLTGALLPFFSEKVAVDRPAVDRSFASATRILAFIAFPLCFGAAGVMPSLIALFFGPHFADASLPGAIIVMATGLAAPGAVGTYVLYARDRSDFIFFSNATGAVLSILAGLVIIPYFGLIGAACSRAAIQSLLSVGGFVFLGAYLKCPVPVGYMLRLLLCASICGLAALITLTNLPPNLALVPAVLAGATAYAVSVRLARALPEEDIDRLIEMQERLPSALRFTSTALLRFLAGAPSRSLVNRHV